MAEYPGELEATAGPGLRRRAGAGVSGDRVFTGVVRVVAASFVGLVLALVVTLVVAAAPAIRTFGRRFIVGTDWNPVTESFGALPFVYGTLLSSLLAMALAVPLGIGAAIYLAELAPLRIRPPVAFLIELLAAVPSVVYGLWGIFVLAPLMRVWVQPALGASLGFLIARFLERVADHATNIAEMVIFMVDSKMVRYMLA